MEDSMELETNVVDTETAAPEATSQEMPDQGAPAEAQPTQGETEQQRKWKLKVNGEDLDLTEPEVLKYAQLGKAGQRAMEKAAALEKKHKELYAQLQQTAEKDPYLLYQVLTGKTHPKAMNAAPQQATAQGDQSADDPRDIELREYKEKLSRIEQRLEQEDIERERKAVENELNDAVKKYPELDSPFLKSYVKSEYRKALLNNADMSLEDVAFLVAQEHKRYEAQRSKVTQQKLEANKQKAPVIAPPSGGGTSKKEMTLEDVKRLAGRQV
jgi:hypothetical protein